MVYLVSVLLISCTDLHAIVMHPAIALDVDDE